MAEEFRTGVRVPPLQEPGRSMLAEASLCHRHETWQSRDIPTASTPSACTASAPCMPPSQLNILSQAAPTIDSIAPWRLSAVKPPGSAALDSRMPSSASRASARTRSSDVTAPLPPHALPHKLGRSLVTDELVQDAQKPISANRIHRNLQPEATLRLERKSETAPSSFMPPTRARTPPRTGSIQDMLACAPVAPMLSGASSLLGRPPARHGTTLQRSPSLQLARQNMDAAGQQLVESLDDAEQTSHVRSQGPRSNLEPTAPQHSMCPLPPQTTNLERPASVGVLRDRTRPAPPLTAGTLERHAALQASLAELRSVVGSNLHSLGATYTSARQELGHESRSDAGGRFHSDH